jgi:hypothetical protein
VVDLQLPSIIRLPILIEIQDTGDLPTIAIGVITMLIVMRSMARITSDHGSRSS